MGREGDAMTRASSSGLFTVTAALQLAPAIIGPSGPDPGPSPHPLERTAAVSRTSSTLIVCVGMCQRREIVVEGKVHFCGSYTGYASWLAEKEIIHNLFSFNKL